jgi:hypothetical protein
VLTVLLLAGAVLFVWAIALRPTRPAAKRPPVPARPASLSTPSGGVVMSEPLYARLVIADGEHRSEPVTVDLRELPCAPLPRLVTITEPAVIG